MVHEGISSALILESDADWDVMLRQQLQEFARGCRYLQGYTEETETHSPYGDKWDLHWVGHCGMVADTSTSQEYWVIEDEPTVIPRSMWGYLPDKTLDTMPPRHGQGFQPLHLQATPKWPVFCWLRPQPQRRGENALGILGQASSARGDAVR